jgi:pyruvate kinase
MVWGSDVHLVEQVKHTDDMMHQVDEILLGKNIAKIGDEVVCIGNIQSDWMHRYSSTFLLTSW